MIISIEYFLQEPFQIVGVGRRDFHEFQRALVLEIGILQFLHPDDLAENIKSGEVVIEIIVDLNPHKIPCIHLLRKAQQDAVFADVDRITEAAVGAAGGEIFGG